MEAATHGEYIHVLYIYPFITIYIHFHWKSSDHIKCIYIYMVGGGIPTPLKNMKVSWDDDSQHMEQ